MSLGINYMKTITIYGNYQCQSITHQTTQQTEKAGDLKPKIWRESYACIYFQKLFPTVFKSKSQTTEE